MSSFEFPRGNVWEQDVPPGHIASIVTHLRRTKGPRSERVSQWPTGFEFAWVADMPGADYRALFEQVGGPWLWFSRLAMNDAAIEEALHKPGTQLGVLCDDGESVGFVEMAHANDDALYVSYLGVAPGYEGKGLGRRLIEAGISKSWHDGCSAVLTHTCSLDHPSALSFYQRCGFEATRRAVEIAPDPRLTGLLPANTRAQHPLL